MIKLILLLASLVCAEVYQNPDFHGRFTIPGGWSIDAPVVRGNSGLTFQATRVGLKPVTVGMWRFLSHTGATLGEEQACFLFLSEAHKKTAHYKTLPYLVEIADTTLEMNASFFKVHLRHDEEQTDWVMLSQCRGIYCFEVQFITSITDYDANAELYYSIFNNLHFYIPTEQKKP